MQSRNLDIEPISRVEDPEIASDKAVLFYDGLCGFCDRTVQYVLDRDREDRFLFATLQGGLAHRILPKHGKNPADLNTLYLLLNPGLADESVLAKSDAAIAIARLLGGGTKWLALFLGIFPRKVRDWGYDRVAQNRYRLLGKLESCRVPQQSERQKFITD